MLTLVFGLSSLGFPSQLRPQNSFPMQEGTVWVYRGIVSWYDMQLKKRVKTAVESKVEVLRVIHREGLVATVVRGFPSDHDWSEGEATRDNRLFVNSDTGEVYAFSGEDVVKNLKRIDDPRDSLQGMWTIDDLLMKLPLKKGRKFCDAESRARTDDHYCWVVASVREVNLSDVKGLKTGTYTAYLLQYVTNPDDTEFEFVPGIGFISYRYHHHGTVADTEMKLVEYHSSANAQSISGLNR
jgi:hypothetical protein